jgi:hypothetical protein
MIIQPQLQGNRHRVNTLLFPPAMLGGATVQVAVMEGAERYDIFVADFLTKASTLGEAEMMGMRGLPIADEAGKFSHMSQMAFVTDPAFES